MGDKAFDAVFLLLSEDVVWLIAMATVFALAHLRRDVVCIRFFWLAALATGISDVLAFRLLKPFFGRIRPCYQFPELVRLVQASCGSEFGFPSNHAANGMAMATIGICLLKPRYSIVVAALAVLVGFSRIYLGVHFPGDVLFGFFVGASVALAILVIERRVLKFAKHVK